MKPYRYVIFDVDDTLLDFSCAYKGAQQDIAAELGIEYTEAFAQLDDRCGWRAWGESGLDRTESREVQEHYHEYYMRYLENHYTYLQRELGIDMDIHALVTCYLKSVTASRVLMEEDTLRIYQSLSERYRMVLATNGLTDMQSARAADFLPCTYRLYISESVEHIKPTIEFFRHMMGDLSCGAGECLMVSDSITNDIAGAKAAGIDVCFYNRRGKSLPDEISVNYEINSICELEKILLR